jgi:hypothetical protein
VVVVVVVVLTSGGELITNGVCMSPSKNVSISPKTSDAISDVSEVHDTVITFPLADSVAVSELIPPTRFSSQAVRVWLINGASCVKSDPVNVAEPLSWPGSSLIVAASTILRLESVIVEMEAKTPIVKDFKVIVPAFAKVIGLNTRH